MADQQPPQDQQRQIQLRIDESKMATTYANTIRTSTMPDEMVMDFGINMPMPTQEGQQVLVFSVGSRIIMNWSAAKRLAISLGQAVRQYEEQHGEIKLQQQGQPGQPGGGPRLAT
jgi:hypothetical protein